MKKDLRSFLIDLQNNSPEEIVSLEKPINSKWEVSALQLKLEKENRFPVILCEKPVNDNGKQTEFKLITNLFASRQRCAMAIGASSKEVAKIYSAKSQKKLRPIVVSSSEAPVKNKIFIGDEVNLGDFPIVWHHELDPGPYITAGFFTTVDPDTGKHNGSLQRGWVKAKNKTGIFPNIGSHNWQNLMKWWESGKDAPVAIWIGHHPAAYLGCQSYGRIPYSEDHYDYIGGLMEEPLDVVPSQTFGSQLMIPANAEVVIEGVCPKYHFEAEGPFGERPGYTGGQRPNPVIEIKAITCREDAIWHDIFVGHPDNYVAGGFAIECQVYERIKSVVPDLINVYAPPSTGCRDHVYVQVRKKIQGVGRNAALAALNCTPKHSFIFDDDIDIFNEREVLWAIATRSQWDRDLIVINGVEVSPLDPSVPGTPGIGAKAALDCTLPPPPEPGMMPLFSPVSRVPKEVLSAFEIEDYISLEKLNKIQKEL